MGAEQHSGSLTDIDLCPRPSHFPSHVVTSNCFVFHHKSSVRQLSRGIRRLQQRDELPRMRQTLG